MPKESGNCFHDNVDDSGSHSRDEVILQEAIPPPYHFQFAAKHPQDEHVHKNMPDRCGVVQEEVRERLPKSQARNHAGGHQAEPKQQLLMREHSRILTIKDLEEKDREVRYEESLHTRSDEEVEAKLIVLYAGPRSHIKQSTSVSRVRQKWMAKLCKIYVTKSAD